MNFSPKIMAFFTAMSVGFLIGTVRERLHQPGALMAGIRTHTVAALIGAVALYLGAAIFLVALALMGILIGIGYDRSYIRDPGMTGEVSLALTVLLGGLAIESSQLAAALGVTVACLLFFKKPLRQFSQELLSERELEDALILFAAVVVVLPILSREAIDPWGTFKPFAIWKVVVVIMFAGMMGHLAIRLTGVRWGLPLAGFFSGFVSSTAVIMDLGRRVKDKPEVSDIACAASLLSTLASLVLFALVIGASSPALLGDVVWPLFCGGLSLLVLALVWFKRRPLPTDFSLPSTEGAFQFKHVLFIAVSISSVSLISTWMGIWFGESGTLASAVIVGFAEIHAAAVGISQLSIQHGSVTALAKWGVIGILAASVVSKSTLSYISGGGHYGGKVTLSLVIFISAAALAMLF